MDTPRYTTMARVYDAWMEADPPPYEAWVDFIDAEWVRHAESSQRRLLEIGCGTGNMSKLFADRGWVVRGIDASEGMISEAASKGLRRCTFHVDSAPSLARTDETPADLAVACFDTLNYLDSASALASTFEAVSTRLERGGLFVFDLNTSFRLERIWGSNHWGDDFGTFAYVWRNSYDAARRTCEIDISFFVSQLDGSFARSTEHHSQRWFSDSEVLAGLSAAGFEVLRVAAAYSFLAPDPATQRVSWTALKR